MSVSQNGVSPALTVVEKLGIPMTHPLRTRGILFWAAKIREVDQTDLIEKNMGSWRSEVANTEGSTSNNGGRTRHGLQLEKQH